MFEEYDLISRGMEADNTGSYQAAGQNGTGDETANQGPALEGYERVFDMKVALRPVTLIMTTH